MNYNNETYLKDLNGVAKSPKISVLIPVYNTEKYLRQCLDSVIKQTLKDLEIIIINDGTKDNSLTIIKEYMEYDKRIKFIDKPNEGYGATMNRGIDAATGEYIGIVESDDWIELDMYETLYNIGKKHDVDIVKSNFFYFDDKNNKDVSLSTPSKYNLNKLLNPREHIDIFVESPGIWRSIYRSKFLLENRIRFLETAGASYQDIGFNFKTLVMAKNMQLIAKPLLHYRINNPNQSVADKSKVFCICDEFKEIERYMSDKAEIFTALEKIFNRVKYNYYIWNLNRLSGKDRKLFQKVMIDELSPSLRACKIDMTDLNWLNISKMQKLLEPTIINVIKYQLVRIMRLFIKAKYCSDYKKYYVMGFILFYKRRLTRQIYGGAI